MTAFAFGCESEKEFSVFDIADVMENKGEDKCIYFWSERKVAKWLLKFFIDIFKILMMMLISPFQSWKNREVIITAYDIRRAEICGSRFIKRGLVNLTDWVCHQRGLNLQLLRLWLQFDNACSSSYFLGWKLEVQRNPNSIHCSILPSHLKSADQWIEDLKEAVNHVKVINYFATRIPDDLDGIKRLSSPK